MEPFVGQIQPLAFNFAPRGWAQCDGQLLPISQNSALFALLGTTYGGERQDPPSRCRICVAASPCISAPPDRRALLARGKGRRWKRSPSTSPNCRCTITHSWASSADAASTNRSRWIGTWPRHMRGGQTPNDFYGPMTPPQTLNSDRWVRWEHRSPRQHAALSDDQLVHRHGRYFSVAQLKRPGTIVTREASFHERTISRTDHHVRWQFRAKRIRAL